MRTYKYLYYKLYCIWQRKKNESENARINAVISITFLLCLNIVSIPLVGIAILGHEAINLPNLPERWILFLAVIASGVGQYFLLAHNKRHLKTAREFGGESELKRKKGLTYTWIYIIISIGLPLLFLFYFAQMSK